MKPTGSQKDTGDLLKVKKKLKVRKGLKEEMRQWEESKHCPDAETEALEPPYKKKTMEKDRINKESTGV